MACKTRSRLLVADSRLGPGPVLGGPIRRVGRVQGRALRACADFRSLHAEEGFVLANCHFAPDSLFRGATVFKKWEAGGSRFDGLLDLSKAKLHDFAYLENIEQGPNQQFAFQNAVAERILIRTDQLEGRLASEQAGDHARGHARVRALEAGLRGTTPLRPGRLGLLSLQGQPAALPPAVLAPAVDRARPVL